MERLEVVLFHTVHAAFVLEKRLRQRGISSKLIPTPRHLSSDCGTALRFNADDREGVEQAISKANLDVVGIFNSDD